MAELTVVGAAGATSAVLLLGADVHDAALDRLAAALRLALGEAWDVRPATLGARDDPSTRVRATVERAVADGARTLVAVSASPHFEPGVGAQAFAALHRALAVSAVPVTLRTHPAWHDDAGYVAAVARAVADAATARGLGPADTHLRFLAPRAGSGEPCAGAWRARLCRTVELVLARVGWPGGAASLGFEGEADARAPGQRLLLCPLSPVGTPEASAPGARDSTVVVCAPLLTSPPFLAALKRLVLKGERPVPPGKRVAEPLLTSRRTGPGAPSAGGDARLVLLGASLRGVLHGGAGPRVRHSDPRAFARARKSHQDVGAFLEWVREATPVREALLWNTCQRSELYAWLPASWDATGREILLGRLRRALFGHEPNGLAVTVLEGAPARHHLLRTACGLNSDLPGDRDVTAQLRAALRRAEAAGTAAAAATALVEDAERVAHEVSTSTAFGAFSTGYCAAALTRVFEADDLHPASLRHVAVGGSTTSRSVLEALRTAHHVPQAQLTAAYRDHHGQMKQLRAALGGGRRLRVHAYSDERVVAAIADADVVYLGIDQTEPVLDAATLRGLRDFRTRPLTVVDFNTYGSLDASAGPAGVRIWPAAELDDAVAAHAAITTTREGFAAALGEAEAWIARRVAHAERASGSVSGTAGTAGTADASAGASADARRGAGV